MAGDSKHKHDIEEMVLHNKAKDNSVDISLDNIFTL